MQETLPLARFTPLVIDEPVTQNRLYPYSYNERVQEQFSYSPPPSRAEQGGAYGDIRARPSRVQIAGSFHPYDYVMEDRFVFADLHDVRNLAWLPQGQMQAFDQRTNIEVPQHVAYGSLFQTATPSYGYG